MPATRVTHLFVRRGRLDVETATPLRHLHVSEETARRVCGLLPNLPSHVCVNREGGPTFGEEVVGTELPHLLEHVVIELQGQACRGLPGRPELVGHTSWAEELSATAPEGYALMRTTVSFADDVVALRAVKEALPVLDWACGVAGAGMPDVAASVARLRSLAQGK